MTSRFATDTDRATAVRQRLRRVLRPVWMGTLRRTTPISLQWGYDRGRPIDRYYIERFIRAHRSDITGCVLEVKEALYTKRYGAPGVHSDVIDIDATNGKATLVADLAAATGIGTSRFDCCIITQTLQYVYDAKAAVRELYRILRPGGVALVTVPCVSRLDYHAAHPDYWRFTQDSCARLFGEVFGSSHTEVTGHGNVLASVAFLQGLAEEELSSAELDVNDRMFPLIVTVRAVKRIEP